MVNSCELMPIKFSISTYKFTRPKIKRQSIICISIFVMHKYCIVGLSTHEMDSLRHLPLTSYASQGVYFSCFFQKVIIFKIYDKDFFRIFLITVLTWPITQYRLDAFRDTLYSIAPNEVDMNKYYC